MSKALTRDQIHGIRRSAKQTFIDFVVYTTRNFVEEYISSDYEEDTIPTGATINFVLTRKQLGYTQEIYAELKDHFPDCAIHLKLKENKRFLIPCWKQYMLEVMIKWD